MTVHILLEVLEMNNTLSTTSGSIEVLAPGQAVRPSFMTQSSHVYLQFVTVAEADQIHNRFVDVGFKPGHQIMWTGVSRDRVQRWADANSMQTLTSVMGPLMDKKHPSCLKLKKSTKEWTAYVKGASALFALHVPKGDVVTVITRLPPQTYNPSGDSTYQTIEEPILKGHEGSEAVSRINMLHLTFAGAEQHQYQVWPVDQTYSWIEKFGMHLSKVLSITGDEKEKSKEQKEQRKQMEKNKKEQRQKQGQEQFLKGTKEQNKRKYQEQVEQEEHKNCERKEEEKNDRALKEKRRMEKERKEEEQREQREERKKKKREKQERKQAIKAKRKMENKMKELERKEQKDERRKKNRESRKEKMLLRNEGKSRIRRKMGKREQRGNRKQSPQQQMECKAEEEKEKDANCVEEASKSYERAEEHGEGRNSGSKDSPWAVMTSEQVRKVRAVRDHVDGDLRVSVRPNDELTEAQETSAYSGTIPVEAQTGETKTTNEIGEGEHSQLPQASCSSNGSDVRHRDANKIVLSKKPRVLTLRSRVILFH